MGPLSGTAARIVSAAYEAFVSGGIDAVSMRRLGSSVHVTAPALYKHFANKDAVIEAVAERGFALFERRLAARKVPSRPEAAIEYVLARYIDFALEKPHLFEIMFVTPRARLRRFPGDFAAGRSAAFKLLRGHVDAGIDSGAFRRDDSLEVTRDLWAFAHGYVGLFRAGRFGSDRRAFRKAFDAALPRLLRGLR